MGPITLTILILLAAAVLSTALSRNDGTGWGSLALLCSFIGARISTHFDDPYILAPFLIASFFLSIKWKYWIGYTLGLIYALRMVWIAATGVTGVNHEIFWIINNEVFVLIQALLGIYGGTRQGGIRNSLYALYNFGSLSHVRGINQDRSDKGDNK